jgi:signal transduction histidine kinase
VVLNAYESIRRVGRKPARIDITAEAEARDRVRLSVTDNGAGLAAEQLTRIFQRGYTSKSGSQSGLGLHWCANTLKASGGSIRIESRGPDQGATVHIELPVAAASAPVASERPAGVHRLAHELATRSESA